MADQALMNNNMSEEEKKKKMLNNKPEQNDGANNNQNAPSGKPNDGNVNYQPAQNNGGPPATPSDNLNKQWRAKLVLKKPSSGDNTNPENKDDKNEKSDENKNDDNKKDNKKDEKKDNKKDKDNDNDKESDDSKNDQKDDDNSSDDSGSEDPVNDEDNEPQENEDEKPEVEDQKEEKKDRLASSREKMQELNKKYKEKTLKRKEDFGDILQLRKAFEGYKSGDEDSYMKAKESLKDKIMGGKDKVEEGNEKKEAAETLGGHIKEVDDATGKKGQKTFVEVNKEFQDAAPSKKDIPIVGTIKQMVDNIKEYIKKRSKSSEEDAKDKFSGLLETTENALKIFGKVKGAISALISQIPFLSTILKVVNIIRDVVKIVKAQKQRTRMNDAKRLFKDKYLKAGDSEAQGSDGLVKMVSKYNPRRFWKKTEFTISEKNMDKREKMLMEARDIKDISNEQRAKFNEELKDIMEYKLKTKMGKKQRNIQFKGVAGIIKNVGKIAAEFTTIFGGNVLEIAESIAKHGKKAKEAYDAVNKLRQGGGDNRKGKGATLTRYLLEVVGSLPQTFDTDDKVVAYTSMKDTIEATGNPDSFYDQGKEINKISDPIEKSEKKNDAFDMFIALFEE